MAGRRTNLALFGLLAGALGSGILAYALGTGWARWAVVGHGVLGLGLVLLAPWKSIIARRGLRRRRPGSAASVVFTLLLVVTIVFGILHATGLVVSMGPLSSMQVHVGAALLAVPLAVWHVRARRVRFRPTDVSRRNVLRAGLLAGGAGLAYLAVEGIVRLGSLPGARRRFTGSHETGSFRPEAMPVTQWLNDAVPDVDPATWRLLVSGEGASRSWTYEQLSAFEDRIRATLDCTGGWYADQDWEGVWLSQLLPVVGEARSISVRSVTGYPRRFPVSDASRLLLATRAGGRPLDAGHGFPARLVAPGRRGFWWVKWVQEIELSTVPWWWQPPFPVS
jgi:Oxidoreductase molybdopterin binding domain